MPEPAARRARRREGFPGQRMVVLPRPVLAKLLRDGHPLGVLPTDVGYFPDACGHHVQRPHGVDQTILILCCAGEGRVQIGGRTLTVLPGHLLVIRENLPHAYSAASERPWTIYWMHLAGPACRAATQLLADGSATPLIDVGRGAEFGHFFEQVFDLLCDSGTPGSVLRASLVAAGLLERFIDARQQAGGEGDPRGRMKRVVRFMWRRINTRVTLGELAEAANLSTSHFAACFRSHSGMPPLEYFLRLQMQQAVFLLDNTALSIKAVAARVGYEDPLYFSRRFRKYRGVSPAQHRAMDRNPNAARPDRKAGRSGRRGNP